MTLFDIIEGLMSTALAFAQIIFIPGYLFVKGRTWWNNGKKVLGALTLALALLVIGYNFVKYPPDPETSSDMVQDGYDLD